MGNGNIKINENQSKIDCMLILGTYYNENIFKLISENENNKENTLNNLNNTLNSSSSCSFNNNNKITLEQFLISFKDFNYYNKDYLKIIYKISLIHFNIRKILLQNDILRYLSLLLKNKKENNPKLIEYSIGIIRNFSLDKENNLILIDFIQQHNWKEILQINYNNNYNINNNNNNIYEKEEEEDIKEDYKLNYGTIEHFAALFRNLTLSAENVTPIYETNILKLIKNVLIHYEINSNTEQNIVGLIWNLISNQDYLIPIYETDLLSYLIPMLGNGTIFTKINITGIILYFAMNKSLTISTFHTENLLKSLTHLFRQVFLLNYEENKTTVTTSHILQEHITGILLMFSLYSELKVFIYKSHIINDIFEFLNMTKIGENIHNERYSYVSIEHCQNIIIYLAQERSLRKTLCDDWKKWNMKPSLLSLLQLKSCQTSESCLNEYDESEEQ